ncbi:MAG TPA: glycosyltransferase [Chloroflexia bacterium]|nr:glycosyltransferase [Chloroflexia bacterium]
MPNKGVVFFYPRLKKLTGAERLILTLADYVGRAGPPVTLLTHRMAAACRPALAPGVRLRETGRRLEWTGRHYADAALEYLLGPWLLRALPPLRTVAGLCFFGPPSLPALWWAKRVLLPWRGRRDIPCLYFCFEPPRVIYSDTAAISRRLGGAGRGLRLAAAVYKGIDRRMVGAADALLGNSPYGARLLEQAYGRPAVVLPHGVDFPAPDPRRVAAVRAAFGLGDRPLAITVNHLHPRKRIAMFLQALALARAAGHDLAGVVVGGGPERARLEALAVRLQLGAHVRFAGFVPEADLPAYYRAADLYVHTALQESFGLSVIEAAALGLPVIAVAEGGPTATVQDGVTGLLVASTAEAVAAGLGRLVPDAPARRRMGAAAAAYIAATYRWTDGARVFLDQLAAARRRDELRVEAPGEGLGVGG